MSNSELYDKLLEIYDKMEDSFNRSNSIDVWEADIAWGHLEDELEKLRELIDEIYEEGLEK